MLLNSIPILHNSFLLSLILAVPAAAMPLTVFHDLTLSRFISFLVQSSTSLSFDLVCLMYWERTVDAPQFVMG